MQVDNVGLMTKEKIQIPVQTLKEMFIVMIKIRRVEEKLIELYPAQDMRTPIHLYIGQEAIATGVCINLNREDYVFGTHRGHGHYIAKGGNLKEMMAEFYGKSTGCAKGKGGSMHLVSPKVGLPGNTAIVGGCMPLAVGAALAFKMREERRVSVAFFGDGAVDTGVFHESLNFASLKKLPVLFVCENNFYATNSHLLKRLSEDNIYKRAEAYSIPGLRVDGNDVLQVYKISKEAIEKARRGEGPTLMECRTYRWMQHVGPDTDYQRGCRPKEELDEWRQNCPIKRYKEFLIQHHILSEGEIECILKEVEREIEEAVIFAKESPLPFESEVFEDVYKDGR
jgi:pyruvate dehydrogenase E1 component alpha subunit